MTDSLPALKFDSGGFFSSDTLYTTEVTSGPGGVAGDPVPYTVHGDSILTTLLLASFMLAIYATANARALVVRQLRSFIYIHREGTSEFTETATELRFQLFLTLLTCIILSLLSYFYTITYFGDTFRLQTTYEFIAIFLGIFIVYFLLKSLLYTLVNLTFFDGKRNLQWLKFFLFITALEGVLSMPAVAVHEYMDISTRSVEIYFAILFLIVKSLTFFKAYTIFFKSSVVKFQIILYLCALEIIPVLTLCGVLVMVAKQLIINF
jgi:hypothetical protein